MGEGVPVLFEAGAGEWSVHWSLVMQALGAGFQAISYDRAGLGWSEAASGDRIVPLLADELLALLDALSVQEPVIVAAHSFGASIARMLASRAPARIFGIVFVDGWDPSFADWEKSQPQPDGPSLTTRVLLAFDRIGVLGLIARVLNRIRPPQCPWALSPADWNAMLRLSSTRAHLRAAMQEAASFAAGDEVVRTITALEVPVIALVATNTLAANLVPPTYPIDAHNRAWQAASSNLTTLSSRSSLRLVEDSDHLIQLARPELVAEAVRELRS
jgi:pimeloyl-ACP methyl ester carboxylesterase